MDEKNKITNHLLRRFKELESQRQSYENTWDLITDYVLPHRGDFRSKKSPGQLRTRQLYDTTAVQANEFLAATLHGGLTNSLNRWFELKTKNPQVNANEDIKQFFETTTNIMYDIFNSPITNFQSQNHELFLDLVAYGTACMYVDDIKGTGIRFKAVHLSELYIAEDKVGHIDTVFRKFKFSARQAAQFWGANKLSKQMVKALEKNPDQKFEILHCVKPNEDYDKFSLKNTKLKYASFYVDLRGKHIIDRSGYHEMPYLIPRWAKVVGETYGRSPAWSAMADIKMLNVMSKTILIATEKQVEPPLLMSDDGVMMPLQTKPGGINFGGIDIDGRPRIQPLQINGRLDAGLKILDDRAKAVKNAYFIDPLFFNQIKSGVSATEISQRQEEKLRLIGSQLGRIQAEYLGPLIQRVYGILSRNEAIPALSDEAAKIVESSGFDIEYTAPLVKTQKSQDPIAFQRVLQSFAPLMNAKPDILDNVNTDRAFRQVAEILGVPLNMLNSSQEVEDIRKARAEQIAQQQQAQMLSEGADKLAQLKKAGVLDEPSK